jgi:hypothetical protein
MIKQYKTSAFSIQHEEEQKQIAIADEAKQLEETKKIEEPKKEQPKQVEKKEQPKEEQPKFVNKL